MKNGFLRVMTLNLWNTQGPAEARIRHVSRKLPALAPDIVLLQECRRGKTIDQPAELAATIDATVVFDTVDPESPGGPIGNAILSRHRIRSHESAALPSPPGDARRVLCASIETPEGHIAVGTTHLSWELDAAIARERQAVAADRFLRDFPSDLPRIWGGDLNCAPDSEVVRFLTGRCSLEGQATYWRDAFARRHPHADGWTWARRNPFVGRHIEPDRRIDYIFAGIPHRGQGFEGGAGSVEDARVCLDEPDENGVFASDHFAVIVDIKL
jgi:endonuclease/exonuclease/phosphatase family metal-dependent hydrolase